MLQALTVSRLSGGDKQALQEVIEVEAAIIRAGAEDREFLRDLHRQFVNSEKYGLGLHYRYWVALGNIGDKKFAEAAADLDALVKSGFQHSRLKFHLENSLKASGQASRVHPPLQLQPGQDVLGQLQTAGLWQPSQPLRLHLGCGEQHFDGYLNLDYPPSSHNVMQVQADAWANILTLDFPDQSVDEVRLHHVFEHFNRVTALAMLIKWHRWLKVGGQLCIETPDLMGSAKTLLSDKSFKTKMGVARHLAGDQAATWAYHLEHWFPERYKHTLGQLGFENIKVETSSWPHEPCLSNVTARAVKQRVVSLEDQLRAADDLLWQSTVADVEKPTHDVWIRQLRAVLNDALVERPVNAALPDLSAIKNAPTLLGHSSSKFTLDEIHNFNQTDRDAWVRAKAATIPSGARVLDVGAGTCPYRNFFAHCKYETHDFKKYEGVKLGNTSEYGQIDYVSEIVAIPAPDNSFDAILCTEVLEHVPEPIEALREMARLVKPGGRLLITAPLGSGLHQLPFHFYGGYTPEWYRHFAKKFGLEVFGITPNGGFFKLLAQECARVAWTFPQHEHLHGKQGKFIRQLFGESLPRYLFALEEKHFIDQFTVGYHVELLKPSIDNMKSSAISFK
jgi:ubiquinone/menaquinone biosynthesis C-methylase UbiE